MFLHVEFLHHNPKILGARAVRCYVYSQRSYKWDLAGVKDVFYQNATNDDPCV